MRADPRKSSTTIHFAQGAGGQVLQLEVEAELLGKAGASTGVPLGRARCSRIFRTGTTFTVEIPREGPAVEMVA